MSKEASLIGADKRPLSKENLKNELARMGLANGDLVLMHVAMHRLGWIIGGAQSLLEAVFEVLGDTGTLVMPGFSSHLSDPAGWNSPAVPASWVEDIRANMPLFDPDMTPTRGIGQVAEALRALPATRRSIHPNDSFLAHGPLARALLDDHSLENSLGQTSPLGRLHAHEAKVLLLGAGYDSCTGFHLAEDGLPGIKSETVRYPHARENGITKWQEAAQSPSFEEHFGTIGAKFEAARASITLGFDGAARLFLMSEAVSFARDWLEEAAQTGQL